MITASSSAAGTNTSVGNITALFLSLTPCFPQIPLASWLDAVSYLYREVTKNFVPLKSVYLVVISIGCQSLPLTHTTEGGRGTSVILLGFKYNLLCPYSVAEIQFPLEIKMNLSEGHLVGWVY